MGILNWIFSEHGIAAALMIITLVKTVETVWAKKESRAERLRRIAIQAFTTAEGIAASTGVKGVDKFAVYMRHARKLAEALGSPLTAGDEKYLEELSIVHAKSAKVAPAVSR